MSKFDTCTIFLVVHRKLITNPTTHCGPPFILIMITVITKIIITLSLNSFLPFSLRLLINFNIILEYTSCINFSMIGIFYLKLFPCSRFIAITDTMSTFDTIAAIPKKWPPEFEARITLQYLAESYPPDRMDMRNLWRSCATQRLFVPAMLPNEDAIIYIDNDFLFMRPPEDLWEYFNKFDSQQVAAMAPYVKNIAMNNKVRWF